MVELVNLCVDIQQPTSEGQLWEIDGTDAVCINNPKLELKVTLGPEETLIDALAQLPEGAPGRLQDKSRYHLEKFPLGRGDYHPRIFRKIVGRELRVSAQDLPRDQNSYIAAMTQVGILMEQLAELCRTIHPDGPNLDAYGHEIRNLLILACTEVETQWKAVLIRIPVILSNSSRQCVFTDENSLSTR